MKNGLSVLKMTNIDVFTQMLTKLKLENDTVLN